MQGHILFFVFAFTFSSTLLWVVQSMDSFPNYIPNGKKVFFQGGLWGAVGHTARKTGGKTTLNAFGKRVQATLKNGKPDWSVLCTEDSDMDGFTNGEELGDPNCTFVYSELVDNSPPLLDGVFATHPGFADNATGVIPSSSPPSGFIAHATLMCLAWVLFAPLGIMSSVFLKKRPSWSPKSGAFLHWFKLHKLFVGTAVYLTLVAYVIMVRETEEFIKDNTHTRFGTAVVLLCFIQPLSGCFRIHVKPDGSKTALRLAWEFIHQKTGRVTVLLAVIAIYFGFKISSEDFGYIEEDTADAVSILVLALFSVVTVLLTLYVLFLRGDFDWRRPFGSVTKSEEKTEPGKRHENNGQPKTLNDMNGGAVEKGINLN